jgi:hypothetical protein
MGKERFGQTAKIEFVDYFPRVKGILRYKVYRHIGDKKVLIEEDDGHNLVVDLARIQLAHLVAGEVEDRSIVRIALGTDNTPPTVADTGITDPLIKDVDDYEYPEPGQVKFNWGLSVNEGNGMEITEFGWSRSGKTAFINLRQKTM